MVVAYRVNPLTATIARRLVKVRYASLLAPVALVSAVSATTTFFVFLFSILLTLFFPKLGREDLSARNVVQKAIGGVLIMAGVALIQSLAK